MGKKSKIFKGGLNKKNYQVVLKAKKLNKQKVIYDEEDNLSEGWESDHDNDSEMDIDKKDTATNNQSQIIRKPGQLRHRRNVRKSAPTKGQRKRQVKKDRFIRRDLLIEKIKSQDKLGNTTLNASSIQKLNKSATEDNKSKGLFNMKEIDNNLFSFVEEMKKMSVKTQKKKRNVVISEAERKKLSNMLTNKDYLNNPGSAIKKQIKQTQLTKERNANIEKELNNLKFN